jgi:glycosyltransferase involved in cell wall biosynthesis
MLVSLILPIKNGMPHLINAIEGLKKQTYQNFELIVQDSCSTDGSVEFLNSLKLFFPIRIFVEQDFSLSDGYNRGIQRSGGSLVSLIACDEVLDPGAIESYVAWFKERPDAVFICGGSRLLNDNERVYQDFSPQPFTLLSYLEHLTCQTMCGAFNRDNLGSNFYYDTSLSTVPDFEIIIRMALLYGEHRIIFRPEINMTARADRSSMTYRKECYDQFVQDKLTILDRHFDDLSEAGLPNFLYKKAVFGIYQWAARSLFSINGGQELGVKYALMAEKILPGSEGLKYLANPGAHLRWIGKERRLEKVQDFSVCLRLPDKKFQMINLGAQDIASWGVVDGASVELNGGLVSIHTSPNAWKYALLFKIPLNPDDLIANLIWFELNARSTLGAITASMFNTRENIIYGETVIANDSDFKEYFFECFSEEYDSILIRNAGLNVAGHLLIKSMRLVLVDRKIAMEI